eukprot:m.11872 g.11872  ORF g.11872 m.11872 type:complete len:232 (+) comp3907_c0_seq1:85-780(+)
MEDDGIRVSSVDDTYCNTQSDTNMRNRFGRSPNNTDDPHPTYSEQNNNSNHNNNTTTNNNIDDSNLSSNPNTGESNNSEHASTSPQEEEEKSMSSYSCRICLDIAHDPVVTKCGHLYCWPCLHEWLQRKEECPVCKAGVTKENVIPLFVSETETDPRTKNIPHRPRAERPPNMSDTNAFFRANMFFPFFQFRMDLGGANNENMTEEQRRAHREGSIWLFMGMLVIFLLLWL